MKNLNGQAWNANLSYPSVRTTQVWTLPEPLQRLFWLRFQSISNVLRGVQVNGGSAINVKGLIYKTRVSLDNVVHVSLPHFAITIQCRYRSSGNTEQQCGQRFAMHMTLIPCDPAGNAKWRRPRELPCHRHFIMVLPCCEPECHLRLPLCQHLQTIFTQNQASKFVTFCDFGQHVEIKFYAKDGFPTTL